MNKIDKVVRYTKLYSIYHSQLSKSQQEIINDYYFADLSLSEIAENRGVSRSAIEDALSKGCAKLDELEKELKVYEKSENIQQKLDILKEKALNMKEIEEIEEIEKELDYGIWSTDW